MLLVSIKNTKKIFFLNLKKYTVTVVILFCFLLLTDSIKVPGSFINRPGMLHFIEFLYKSLEIKKTTIYQSRVPKL